MQQLPNGWVTQPKVKGTRVVLKIEIQKAQENILIDEQGTDCGVLLHGGDPDPEHRGVIHAAARQQKGSIGKEAFSTLCTGLKQNYGSLWEYGKLSYYAGSLIFAKEKAFLGTVCPTVDINTMASVKVIKCS